MGDVSPGSEGASEFDPHACDQYPITRTDIAVPRMRENWIQTKF